MVTLLDPRNGPDFDLDAGPAPRTFVVASIPRCGSTLLCRSLWDTGLVGAPKEYLNPMQRRDWLIRFGSPAKRTGAAVIRGPLQGLLGRIPWSDQSLRDPLDRVRGVRSGPTGWFGVKLHFHHLKPLFVDAGRDPAQWLGDPTWIRIRRTDRLDQAISWARALQTGRWASGQQAILPPVYSQARIQARLDAIDEAERGWSAFFEARDLTPIEITYEQLTTNRGSTLNRVLRGLQVTPPDKLPPEPLTRQADDINASWKARFLDE